MVKVIWKIKLSVTNKQRILIPQGAEILSVQVQNEAPCLWILVKPESQLEDRTFIMHPTGHPIIEVDGHEGKYIGTLQLKGGLLVYHLFEQITKK